ncbi:MAG: hypothetical protein GX621_12515, partial [Pirellulaceae bacterium]|nr:hypothetical protein [Pirellulaceae bacterium]
LFVVQIFGLVGQSVDTSRAVLEMNEQLRSATDRLRKDLQGATADMNPPLSPEAGKGYFEIIEGPIGPVNTLENVAFNTNDPSNIIHDSTVADNDDILMFTSRSRGEPFVGRVFLRSPNPVECRDGRQYSAESPLAEICYFVRGTTLYRRVLLVKPEFDCDTVMLSPVNEHPRTVGITPLSYRRLYSGLPSGSGVPALPPLFVRLLDQTTRGFYNNFDLSVRLQYDPTNPDDQSQWVWVPNTLADLTKRENRFAHQPTNHAFPHHPHMVLGWQYLGLPTLRECSWCVNPRDPSNVTGAWWPGRPLPAIALTDDDSIDQDNSTNTIGPFDSWNNPLPFNEVDPDTGTLHLPPRSPQSAYMGPRVAEDVLLTNVIGFDVKVWDPGAPLVAVDVRGTPGDPSDDMGLAPGDNAYLAALQQAITGGAGPFPVVPTIVGYGAYVDLGYAPSYDYTLVSGAPRPWFNTAGNPPGPQYVYDTWSTHYETTGADGFDNTGDGIVDGVSEQTAPPPHARPLRGIQIKIRMFEPDSRRAREMTIVHDFLSE